MKRTTCLLALLLMALVTMAVPAKKGQWKTLPLNGINIQAQLVGDEHLHFWQTADGQQLCERNGSFVPADMQQLRANAQSRRALTTLARQQRVRRNGIGDFTNYSGQKKGLLILVEFANQQFLNGHDSLLYTRICNEEGFSEGQFKGSVYDYFKAQSYGQFELTFDVVGPVSMPQNYAYYGVNDSQGNDLRPGEMVATACQAVDHLVDFNDYDWDGDGQVEQVMCIYAGKGEATGGGANTIWPHEWQLDESDYGSMLQLDGAYINTYAVANERASSGIEGMGTICHEYSHCLGLPDMYDVNYRGNFGMGMWSVLDQGSYNGNGFLPAAYTSFERMTCGWVKPQLLTTNMKVEAMLPIEDEAEVYMVRNEYNTDEYYLIENRQQKGWDAALPGSGLLIIHVDYDYDIWLYNLVNTNNSDTSEGFPFNDHQRCTVVHADNNSNNGSYGDTFPYAGNDSLTNTSMPAATYYNGNGQRLMNKGILDMASNNDAEGTMTFRFRTTPTEVFVPDGTVFIETFSACSGNGGNDGIWSSTMASSVLKPDNKGWSSNKGYGGYMCARFGTIISAGTATTPAINVTTGEAQLTFSAAGWQGDSPTLHLSVEGEGTVKPDAVAMRPFAWQTYTVKLSGSGRLRVKFEGDKRFLLDEVIVTEVEMPSDIQSPSSQPLSNQTHYSPNSEKVFDLQGRRVPSSHFNLHTSRLKPGLYIQNGKLIVR